MNRFHRHRHAVRALAVFVCTVLGLAASAPAALALRVPATFGSSGDAPTGLGATAPPTVVAGGTPGWQITLIVVVVAFVAGTLAVVVDRMRAQRRNRIVPAA
jgi:hypothetical protein